MLRFALDADAHPGVGRCSRKHDGRHPFQTIFALAVANACKIDVGRVGDERLNSLVAVPDMCLVLLLQIP